MNRTPHIVVVSRSTSSAEQLARRVERTGLVVALRREFAALTAGDGRGDHVIVADGAPAEIAELIRRVPGARVLTLGTVSGSSAGYAAAAAGAIPGDADDAMLEAAIRAVSVGLRVTSPAPLRPPVDDAEPVDDELTDNGYAESLTEREREVLELVAHGLSNHAIATRLGISDHTVKFHLASVFGKLDVSSRTGAVRRGLARGLITI